MGDDTLLVEMAGRCNCKVWYPRSAVHTVYDPDTATTPRFPLGTPVECLTENNTWQKGVIDVIWYRGTEWHNRRTAPYRIKLGSSGYVIAPADNDGVVRRQCNNAATISNE